jgi:group I intron endonuclease
MVGIYKITSPNKKIYIGQSINIEKRFKWYLRLYGPNIQPKIYNSLKKYGPENHIFEVIEECEMYKLVEREIYYKNLFVEEHGWGKALFFHLTDGISGPHTQSEDSNLKRSKSLKEYWGGKTHPLSGKIIHPTIIEKRFKPVLQYSLDGSFIKEWSSQLEVYNILGIDINNCLQKRYKSSGKYQWIYKENFIYSNIEPIKSYKKRNKKHCKKISKNKTGKGLKPIFQLDLEGNIVREWESQSKASKEMNLPISCINLCLVGKNKTSGGYKWVYKK